VLTASDVKALKSDWKKFGKAWKAGTLGQVPPSFIGVYAEKTSKAEPDPWSFGAAARGHIMEPYAVEEFNEVTGSSFYHWDDAVVSHGCIGFSPDALDIKQPDKGVEFFSLLGNLHTTSKYPVCSTPTKMLEVKCYEPAHHLKNYMADKMTLDERWQIAVAMETCHSIEEAYLVQFCPDAMVPLFWHTYSREDLADEIKTVNGIVRMWEDMCTRISDACDEMPNKNYEGFEDMVYQRWTESFAG